MFVRQLPATGGGRVVAAPRPTPPLTITADAPGVGRGRRTAARCLLLLAALVWGWAPPARAQTPQRIVSLAPSATEVLFEAGAGSRVVGVTSFCLFPRAVLRLPKVGGYLTPSFEALAALEPDLIVTLPEHADLEPRLSALGIPILRLDHRSLEGIVRSIVTVGERCGTRSTAERAAAALRHDIAPARAAAGRTRPRVLICFGRSEDLSRVYAAAPGTVHDDLIAHAGGANVITSGAASYPTLSAEGVLRLDPDVIIEFAPGGMDAAALRRQWSRLGSLRAVKTGHVHVLTGEHLAVPGPRFARLVPTIAALLRQRP